MSPLQPATDLIVANRGGTNFKTPADMTRLQDTDYLLVNRNGINYKLSYAGWKEAQSEPPIVASVLLQDVAGGGRFTNTQFPFSYSLASPGKPTGTLGFKAWVTGNFYVRPTTSKVVSIGTPVTQPKITGASKVAGGTSQYNFLYADGTYNANSMPQSEFDNRLFRDGVFANGKAPGILFSGEPSYRVHTASFSYTGATVGQTVYFMFNLPNPGSDILKTFGISGNATFANGLSQTSTSQVCGIKLTATSGSFTFDSCVGAGGFPAAITMCSTAGLNTTTSAVVFEDTTDFNSITVGTALQTSDQAVKLLVNGKDAATKTLYLQPITGTLTTGMVLQTSAEVLANGATLYLKLDSSGNVSDVLKNDPGYVSFTGTSSINFSSSPFTSTGRAPDSEFPAGTIMQMAIQSTNIAGSSFAQTPTITPMTVMSRTRLVNTNKIT
jgi:hypothetical protein